MSILSCLLLHLQRSFNRWQTIWSQIEYVSVLVVIVISCVPKDLTVILVFSSPTYTYAEYQQCAITKICSHIKLPYRSASPNFQCSHKILIVKAVKFWYYFLRSMVIVSPTCVAGICCLDHVPKVWTVSIHTFPACELCLLNHIAAWDQYRHQLLGNFLAGNDKNNTIQKVNHFSHILCGYSHCMSKVIVL